MNCFNIGKCDEKHPKVFIIYAQSRSEGIAKHIAYMYNKAYEATGQDTRLDVLSDIELAWKKYSHRYVGEDPRFIY